MSYVPCSQLIKSLKTHIWSPKWHI